MSQSSNKIAQKVERASQLASQSSVMKELMEMSSAEWVGIFAELDEKELDEFLYVMGEEKNGFEEIKQKAKRRLQVNETRRLQRMERLKIRMEAFHDRLKDG